MRDALIQKITSKLLSIYPEQLEGGSEFSKESEAHDCSYGCSGTSTSAREKGWWTANLRLQRDNNMPVKDEMTVLPSYRNPFADQQQVRDLEQRYLKEDSKNFYSDPVALSAGEGIRNRSELRENLKKIFRWKLQRFLKRGFKRVISFPDETISDSKIKVAIEVALDADADEPRTIHEALRALDDLPSVGIPVASAFLMALHPCRFTVIDRQAYKALSVDCPDRRINNLKRDEYVHYLDFCRGQAARLDVSLRSYDRALWQQGSESGRSRKYRKPCSEEEVDGHAKRFCDFP